MSGQLTGRDAAAALAMLGYLSDLFTGSNKGVFTREEVLVVLNLVQNDDELFDPETVLAYEQSWDEWSKENED